MNQKQTWATWTTMAVCAASLGLSGCGGQQYVEAAPPAPTVKKDPFRADVDAGIRVDTGVIDVGALANNRNYGGTRNDPFSLLGAENRYEADQRAARLLSESGGFVLIADPPVETTEVVQPFEAQPYRRLSGVLIGDSVYAIIELENGQTAIIRPGSKIPNSEWTVVSIDAETAVLRREGNRRPHQIVVKLESPPANSGGGGGGRGAGGGAPGGGRRGGGPAGIGGEPGGPGGGAAGGIGGS